ncbi:hypothetical protein [Pseudomonas sp. SCB32]|uniref:hypothetical protein n=1 Tax=Pseudomonas sp. SCB32 TaxID=2653853 RepID=UPI0012659DE0|nr:hypothetical protein [Pseudomonas sp. SCB32]
MNPESPVFIHSLFRAGSTYIFNTFRTAKSNFWCYQEPLHEFILSSKGALENLIIESDALLATLRHPKMSAPHFQEVYEVAESCLPQLSADMCYAGYFGEDIVTSGTPYFSSLIEAAKGRPVIEECRTASRVGTLKNALGGTHIYLWRNPWDQWWSYKTFPYFTHANQVILDSCVGPQPIGILKDSISFTPSDKSSIVEKFDFFYQRPLSANESYLTFYILWCMALREGIAAADILLNIDRLSESADYRQEILDQLQQHDITGLDFSDCRSPCAVYDKEEIQFFEEIEARASEILLKGGWSQSDLDEVASLRKRFAPTPQSNSEKFDSGNVPRDASRARQLALRYENSQSDLAQQLVAKNDEAHLLSCEKEYLSQTLGSREAELSDLKLELKTEHSRREALETEREEALESQRKSDGVISNLQETVAAAEHALERQRIEFELLEKQLEDVLAQLSTSTTTISGLENAITLAERALKEHTVELAATNNQLDGIMNSKSWRITKPLRLGSRSLQAISGRDADLLNKIKQRIKRHCAAFVRLFLHNPELKQKVSMRLARHPRLKAKVKRVVWALDRKLRSAPRYQPLDVPQDNFNPAISPTGLAAGQGIPVRKEAGINQDQKSPLESYFYS